MLFLNEYEIDRAVTLFTDWEDLIDPALIAAARTLSNLRYAVNANSDGWAYWRAPCQAARKLQELIQDGEKAVREGRTVQDAYDRYRAAQTPLKAFRTRTKLYFEIVSVERVVIGL